MDFKQILKKYWFVMLIGLVLIGFVGAYAADAYDNREIKVSTLNVDGKDVIAKIDDQYYYADDLFEEIEELYGGALGYISFQNAVLDEAIETTEELNEYASSWAQYILSYYDEDDILSSISQQGYKSLDELSDYCLATLKYQQFLLDYVKANYDTLVAPVVESENPRIVSHILVKVAEQGNPTEEETAKLNEVLEALKTEDFAEVAKEYSEDSSAEDGGSLGLIYETNKTDYVESFYTSAMSLNYDEVSDVVESEYGYHIIKVTEPSDEDLYNDSDFYSLITEDSSLIIKAVTEKADELGFVIKDEKINEYINSYLETETDATEEEE